MRQRIDLDRPFYVVDGLQTSECVGAVDVHGTGPANPLSAGSPKRERRVDLVLDLNERIQNHRAAVIHINLIGIELRVFARCRIVAVDAELTGVVGAFGSRIGPTTLYP